MHFLSRWRRALRHDKECAESLDRTREAMLASAEREADELRQRLYALRQEQTLALLRKEDLQR
jgi:hypothetical protein